MIFTDKFGNKLNPTLSFTHVIWVPWKDQKKLHALNVTLIDMGRAGRPDTDASLGNTPTRGSDIRVMSD